jgi:hypothetical protein
MYAKKKMRYIDPKTKEQVDKETLIESHKDLRGCKIPLINGCLVPIAVFALMIVCIKECKRADIRLQEEKIKLEHLKDGTLTDSSSIISPDTLKIGGFQKEYIPLLRMNQKGK